MSHSREDQVVTGSGVDRHQRAADAPLAEAVEEQGPKGLLDRRGRTPSHRRLPKKEAEEVLALYRDKYFDLNLRHFHEKLGEEHQIGLSYSWVKQALQSAGLVPRKAKRGGHRKRRQRRPPPGMLLHIDGSHHRWFQGERWHDLIVILDDATSEIYHAQLAEAESTFTVMAGLSAVIEREGLFFGLYSIVGPISGRRRRAGARWVMSIPRR